MREEGNIDYRKWVNGGGSQREVERGWREWVTGVGRSFNDNRTIVIPEGKRSILILVGPNSACPFYFFTHDFIRLSTKLPP